MFENRLPEIRRRRLLLGICCALVAFVGLYRLSGSLTLYSAVITGLRAGLFDSDPGRTLRVIQSIGILLPLFAGLLRFTTNDQPDVNERVNDYLLLGILSLVFGGLFATLAAMVTTVAGILKVALFFVCLTFLVIGVATIIMFSQRSRSTERATSSEVQNGATDEDISIQTSEARTDDYESDDSEDSESQSDQIEREIDSETESSPTERTVESTESDNTDGGSR